MASDTYVKPRVGIPYRTRNEELKGERGKYYEAYKRGHQVRVHKADGSTVVQYFSLKDGAIMLEPDVQRYFPDSESVNKALRTLIALIPNKVSKPKNAKTR